MVQMSSRLGVAAAWLRRHVQVISAGVALLALVGVLIPIVHGNESAAAGPGHTAAASPFAPLVSRDKPVFCAKSIEQVGDKNAITSGVYGQEGSYWGIANNALPSWCAIHIGAGPSQLMVVWYSDYDEDQDRYISNGRMPQSYTLSVSPNSTNGRDGDWSVVATVSGNPAHLRESVIPFTGEGWVKMTITKAQDQPTQDTMAIGQIDCFDVSASLKNTVLFEGDSVTALAFDHSTGPDSFDMLMHGYNPHLFPSMLNEGMGGWTSSDAAQNIDTWLALNPDINYWLLGWGTNDVLQQVDPVTFQANMQIVIDKIKAAGHTPVLAHIPPMVDPTTRAPIMTAQIQSLNQVIIALTASNHLIPGPDLFASYGANPAQYIQADGIHPNPAGAALINRAWYYAMRTILVANL